MTLLPMLPLDTVRVVDLSRVLAGPYCTMTLGDLGADVIKIEQPVIGDDTRQWGPPWAGGESAYYLSVNRNKRSLTLDIKHQQGRAILLDLVRSADILVENMRPGRMDALGLGYERMREINPRLIYLSITGFGSNGPYRDRPGYDFVVQAMGGLMSVTGEEEGEPMKVGVAIVDIFSGLFATIATLGALVERGRSGEGQHVEVALFDTQLACLANVGGNYLVSGERPVRYGNAHPNIAPYQTFCAADRPFALAVGSDKFWRAFCDVISRPDLVDDERFATNPRRVENRQELADLLSAEFVRLPADAWIAALTAAGVPCAPINTVDEALADEHALARGMVVECDHPTAGRISLVGPPFQFSGTPPVMRYPPPLLGQHTEEILSTVLDLRPETIAQLRADKVV
jgi:formyl-CoA transferase